MDTIPSKLHLDNKSFLIGMLLYLIVFNATQLTNIPEHISWWGLSGITALITFTFVYLVSHGNQQKRLTFALLSVILAFVVSFTYSSIAYFKASDMCNQTLSKNYQELVENNPTESNGFKRSWNLTEKCANNLLPFPWGKKATI